MLPSPFSQSDAKLLDRQRRLEEPSTSEYVCPPTPSLAYLAHAKAEHGAKTAIHVLMKMPSYCRQLRADPVICQTLLDFLNCEKGIVAFASNRSAAVDRSTQSRVGNGAFFQNQLLLLILRNPSHSREKGNS